MDKYDDNQKLHPENDKTKFIKSTSNLKSAKWNYSRQHLLNIWVFLKTEINWEKMIVAVGVIKNIYL